MEERLKEIYVLGREAQKGNEVALINLIDKKRNFIKKVSNGNEDCEQHIIEKIIKSLKKYKF